jgi:uncharacterized protein
MNSKINHLRQTLLSSKPLAVAFSGGVDSTFLLKTANEALGDQVVAITADAPNFAPDEIEDAKEFCRQESIRHIVLDISEDAIKTIADNPPDRCYNCKKMIFSRFLAEINKHPELQKMSLADGTNADDSLDYRPGEKAIAELGVLSPLKEAGLTKSEIRAAAKEMGLGIWDKPAFACLASRIPYGDKITPDKLASIYALEKALHRNGFRQVRVRHHGEVARIEVLPEDRKKFIDIKLMDEINQAALSAGFAYAALDLSGYRMGNLNDRINSR